ncbi:MAG TPA: alkaline phosphatase family protein [Candidatus Binatia bacterium]
MMRRRQRAVALFLAVAAALLCAAPRFAHSQSATKAIVLGWDGAVSDFIREMLRDGKLPNLAKLIEGGALADDVKPTFPAKTAPGFASLFTGAPPRVTGISGNRVPRAPRGQFTILESVAGFSEAPLHAEPIWSAAVRAGKKAVISHVPAFAGELSEQAVRFSGYTLTAGRDGIVTKRAIVNEPEAAWSHPPASEAPPVEIAFFVGETRFHGLLIDDPADSQSGYDTLLLATGRDAQEIKVKLKPAPASGFGELFWSEPVAVKLSGHQDGTTYFRLFDLKPDGSDLFLYYTRPARDLSIQPESEVSAGTTARAFIGNGASILYQQGGLGKTIANGGSGGAEARYLETVAIAQHQLMETNRWALDHLPWDLYLAYTPFPDEAEHLWRGYLDPALANYRQDLAARLRPFLERVYRSCDEHLGLLMTKRPANTIIALVSDHGMQGMNKRIALNRALQEGGLLVLDAQGKVDLTKTKVLYPAVNNDYLLINTNDRKNGIVAPEERAALVGKTRDLLGSIRDGEQALVKAIYDADFDGATLGIGGEVGGDLYIELAPGYDFDPHIGSSQLITEAEPYGNHGANPEQASMRTLMVFNGPGVGPGQRFGNASLIDFAPTLASLLQLPEPKDATGRVLYEIFDGPR